MSSICLGTAQLGGSYGINNRVGKLTEEQCFEILECAEKNGIEYLDTAIAYGDSERVIGAYIKNRGVNPFKIISKIPHVESGLSDEEVRSLVLECVNGSLERLCVKELDGYLIHSVKDLNNSALINTLIELKEQGIIKKIGVSVYSVDEGIKADEALPIDFFQFPCNVLDNRFEQSGFLQKLKSKNVTLFARSVYLQGLLLMDEDKANVIGDVDAGYYIRTYRDIADKYGIDYYEGLLKYVSDNTLIDSVVIGVETTEQLLGNINVIKKDRFASAFYEEIKETFSTVDEKLLLPYLWNK